MRYAIASLLLTVFPGGALAQSLNVSDFVFRDMDGDGRYELEDFPYAGANLVARLNDNIVTTTSNLNGFANFVMSDTDQGADFVESGSGVVTYTPPPGMFISTARSSVPFEVVRVEGSIAGFAVDPPVSVPWPRNCATGCRARHGRGFPDMFARRARPDRSIRCDRFCRLHHPDRRSDRAVGAEPCPSGWSNRFPG